jgi:molybdate transport system substrate-binding protein
MRCGYPAILAVALGCGGDAPRAPLTVFAAASLTDAFGEITLVYERQNPDRTVRLNLAGSQQLALQLAQGADADVFASADLRWMQHVRSRVAGEPVAFARNRLVAIVPAANPAGVTSLEHLSRPGLRLVLAAAAVPVGAYSRDALGRLAVDPRFPTDFARRVLENLVSEEENVKAVVAKVQLGEADAGIVYASDVTAALARDVRVVEIPKASNVTATYPIAVLAAGDTAAARAFVAVVTSPAGRAVLARHGFRPP